MFLSFVLPHIYIKRRLMYLRTLVHQTDDTIFLRHPLPHPPPYFGVTTGSVDEIGGPVQLLCSDESWFVGGMVERLH